ncbi:semaphorin-3D-like isoform X1 [Chiloscyllium plagiosum]|uniref:semaphorin-3D-like isoform X1 n=1 Tax=Chiloscyllium plagiosum TaxID=36176 RepID=UPI001CB83248|nr:semaphorin-3D-like isoform X1 [Chiloscyllium plagiosum]
MECKFLIRERDCRSKFASAQFTAMCCCVLIIFLLPVSEAWKQSKPRLTFSYQDLLMNSSCNPFQGSAESSSFQSILVDEERGKLFVGAKDLIFVLNLENLNKEPKKIYWPAANERVDLCKQTGKKATECANFIRLLHHFNKTHVYTCGTGAFHPVCGYIDLGPPTEDLSLKLDLRSLEPGTLKCPYDPIQPFASALVDEYLYAGTSSDFLGRDTALFRSPIHHLENQYIRTEHNNPLWLSDPKFIGMYPISDTSNEDDDKIYIFLRETALDATSTEKAIYSRVARVCKKDVGGQRSLINKWTTFLKARLICSVPGPEGYQTYFDELQDVFLYNSNDDKLPVIYGVFTSSSSVFSGSAVCAYSMAEIRSVFNGPFTHKESPDRHWVEYQGKIPYPRPGTCPNKAFDSTIQTTKDFSDDVVSFIKNHPMMYKAVYPINKRPIFIQVNVGYRITQIVVDRVTAKDGQYAVLFLGTNVGTVIKALSVTKDNLNAEEVLLEELQVFEASTPVLTMEISSKQKQIYVGSKDSVVQLALQRCGAYGTACSECCLARDPYCAWDGNSCCRYVPAPKRQIRRQDIKYGDPIIQCWDQDDYAKHVLTEKKLIFGVQYNSTFLECSPRSQQTSVIWSVQRSLNGQQEEVKYGSRIIKTRLGLLIRHLQEDDAGIYYCRAVENTFTHIITKFHLKIILSDFKPTPMKAGYNEGKSRDSRNRTRLRYKDFLQLLNKPGITVNEYCQQIWRNGKRGQNSKTSAKWKIAPEFKRY